MPNTNNENLKETNVPLAAQTNSENTTKTLKLNPIKVEFATTSSKKSPAINRKNKTKHVFSDGQLSNPRKTKPTKSGSDFKRGKPTNCNNNKQKIKAISRPAAESGYKANTSSENADEIDLLSERLSQTVIRENSDMFAAKWIVTPRDSLEKISARLKSKTMVHDLSGIVPSSSIPDLESELDVLTYPMDNELPHSDTILGNEKIDHSYSKIFGWDPWDKINRKCKRDVKRKKLEKSPAQSRDNSKSRPAKVEICRKDHLAGGELKSALSEIPPPTETSLLHSSEDITRPFRYSAFKKKSVEFINEVIVIWFSEQEVIKETKEPLKKELEQQIRNKEMRLGHAQNVFLECKAACKGEKDDYMATWFKK